MTLTIDTEGARELELRRQLRADGERVAATAARRFPNDAGAAYRYAAELFGRLAADR